MTDPLTHRTRHSWTDSVGLTRRQAVTQSGLSGGGGFEWMWRVSWVWRGEALPLHGRNVQLATLPLRGSAYRWPRCRCRAQRTVGRGGGSRSRRRGALDARHPKVSGCQARVSARVCKEGAPRPQ